MEVKEETSRPLQNKQRLIDLNSKPSTLELDDLARCNIRLVKETARMIKLHQVKHYSLQPRTNLLIMPIKGQILLQLEEKRGDDATILNISRLW